MREAEKLAIRRGGNDLCQYDRLLRMYNDIKNMDRASAAQCRDLEKHVLEIAMSYGEAHEFRTTIEGAALYLFTFLRYPGMPPHNNDAERDIRDTSVLQRNVRHKLCEPDGVNVFAVLVSVSHTCYKQGIFPRIAVEELIKNPDWSIFKPPNIEKKADAVAVAAISS